MGKELIDIEHNEGELINVDGTKMTVKSSVRTLLSADYHLMTILIITMMILA